LQADGWRDVVMHPCLRLASADLAPCACLSIEAERVPPLQSPTMERLRLDASIPFSAENLNALRGFVRNPASTRVVVSPEEHRGSGGGETFAQATTLLDTRRKSDRRYDEEDSTCVERSSRIGFIVLGLIFVAFVGIVITMMGLLYTRVNHVLDRVDGEQVNEIVGLAVASAKNTETTTANLAKASGVAHALALQVQPSVEHALNSTNDMIDQARNFAVHPQWTISGG